jgi:hypothetical protein
LLEAELTKSSVEKWHNFEHQNSQLHLPTIPGLPGGLEKLAAWSIRLFLS